MKVDDIGQGGGSFRGSGRRRRIEEIHEEVTVLEAHHGEGGARQGGCERWC